LAAFVDPGDRAAHRTVAQDGAQILRTDGVEPKFNAPDRPSRLDPFADKLSHMLRQEAGKSRKQKRTVKQLHADPVALGYDGSYNRVAAFAREWKAAQRREQQTCGRGAFVPLVFLPGEAFQFDWSEDWAIIAARKDRPYERAVTARSLDDPLILSRMTGAGSVATGHRFLGGISRTATSQRGQRLTNLKNRHVHEIHKRLIRAYLRYSPGVLQSSGDFDKSINFGHII
jgi:hypothetical protein